MSSAPKVVGRASVVVVGFAAFDGDPYPRDARTGRYLQEPGDDPAGWGPTLRALADPRSELHARVSDWYCLCHPAPKSRPVGGTASDVAQDTKEAVERHLTIEKRPRYHVVTWNTTRPPHDHADVFAFVCRQLREVRYAHPGAEIVLVLSSGTQAMHAALLLAGSIGVVDGPLRLVQVERGEGARLRPQRPIVDVTLKLDTVLKVARATRPALPGSDVAPDVGYDQARSDALRRALDLARNAAAVPFPILLRGERGVGKSTLAALIRAWGPYRNPKRDQEWPSVACGQFPDPETLRVELCGSAKGAFTGVEDRTGLLALADGDTLFLDEIHDLGEENQRMLIRLVEEHRYYRVGDRTPSTSRFRLITGSNKSDAALRLRLAPDFFDRIRDIEIVVPPLRDCREDLPWMWDAAWARVAADAGIEPATGGAFRSEVVDGIARHPLTGNWRDLRRLAVQLVMGLRVGDGDHRGAKAAIKSFMAGAPEQGETPLTDARPAMMDRRQERYFRSLEAQLGRELSDLWKACDGGALPRRVLEELLGSRHRALRAERFIAQEFSDRWERAQGPRQATARPARARRARRTRA